MGSNPTLSASFFLSKMPGICLILMLRQIPEFALRKAIHAEARRGETKHSTRGRGGRASIGLQPHA